MFALPTYDFWEWLHTAPVDATLSNQGNAE